MADIVREKDRIYKEQMEEEEKAKLDVLVAQNKLDELNMRHKDQLTLELS